MQLVDSLCGNYYLILFHLRWRETVLKPKKVYKCFVQDCLNLIVFFLVFTAFKMHGNFNNDLILVERIMFVKIGIAFSIKFVVVAKLKKSPFWNVSKLGFCCNSVVLNINFKSKWVFFLTLKYTENINARGLGRVRDENVFLQVILYKRS